MRLALLGWLAILTLTACGRDMPQPLDTGTVYAPGIDPDGTAIGGLEVGHRLMAAGQPELALEAFTRAAGQDGLTAEVLASLGSANLALGRVGQAESLLRRAIKEDPDWPEAWNNLGVVLIETGRDAEAYETFRRAYALDNGDSDAIRDNLRLALAKMENSLYAPEAEEQQFQLVREGRGQYRIHNAP